MARAAKKTARKTAKRPTVPALVPREDGRGALLTGGVPGNRGGGRIPDAIRAKLRDLGAAKAVPFLADLLDGKVSVSLLGKCDKCGHDQAITPELVEQFVNRTTASIDHRLRATEQTMKYGLAAKELVISDALARDFFDCIDVAICELLSEEIRDRISARTTVLFNQKHGR